MKLQSENRKLEITGFDEADNSKFKIEQNAKMFTILSASIYSDKIMAVIREISCNALDAHIAAGKKDVPFEVHLPNQMEPYFSVKDYGTGLDHEQVMQLYTTYGKSTKGDTNEEVGCLGLGSKSPFAYTDQYQVMSRFDGTVRTYSAYVDRNGEPNIMLLSEEITDEPNGLTIYMPVESQDFNSFARKASEVFYRFDVQPKVTGNFIELPSVKYILEGSNFKIREVNRYENTVSVAIQGPIGYKIDTSVLADKVESDNTLIKLLHNVPMDIEFPMGELNISASREGLHYDPTTTANLIETLKNIRDEIKERIITEVNKAETLWEAKVAYNQLFSNDPALARFSSTFKEIIGRQIEWNGETITSSAHEFLVGQVIKDTRQITDAQGVLKDIDDYTQENWCVRAMSFDREALEKANPRPSYPFPSIKTQASKKTAVILLEDTVKAPVKKVSYNFGRDGKFTGQYTHVIVLQPKPEFADQIKEQLKGVNLFKWEDLEEVPKVSRDQSTIKQGYSIQCRTDTYRPYVRFSDVADIDLEDGGYYAALFSGEFMALSDYDKKAGNRSNDPRLDQVYIVGKQFGLLPDEEVLGINSTYLTKVRDEPQWENIFTDVLQPKMQKLLTDEKLLSDIKDMKKSIYLLEKVSSQIVDFVSEVDSQGFKQKEFVLKSNSNYLKLYDFINDNRKVLEKNFIKYYRFIKNVSSEPYGQDDKKPDLLRLIQGCNKLIETYGNLWVNYKRHFDSSVQTPNLGDFRVNREIKFIEKCQKSYPVLKTILSAQDSRYYDYRDHTKNLSASYTGKTEYNLNIIDVFNYINLCDAAPTAATRGLSITLTHPKHEEKETSTC